MRARVRHAARELAREYPNITTVAIVACVIVVLLVRHVHRRTA